MNVVVLAVFVAAALGEGAAGDLPASAAAPAADDSAERSAADDSAERSAADTAAARAHFDAARAHYDLGRFAEALVEFEKAYQAKPLPKLLFNIGQCHFQEKRYARAIFFYERYLELHPEIENRAVIDDLISEAQRLDAAANADVVKAVPVVAPPAPAPAAAPVEDSGATWALVGAGVLLGVAVVGIAGWAVWVAPPPPGTLGLVDRRSP